MWMMEDTVVAQWNRVCVCVCVHRQRLPSALTWAASVTPTTFQASPTSWNTVRWRSGAGGGFYFEG